MNQFLNIRRLGMDEKMPLRMLIYFIGTVISCLGTALLTLNCLGSDAMNTLFAAIAEKTNILSGGVYTIFNTSMLIAGFLFARRYMGIGSLLMILFQGYFINLWQRLFVEAPWLFTEFHWKTVIAVLSYLFRTFGSALSTAVCLGTAGFEACLFTLADKIKVEYKYLKLTSEVLFFGAALLLDGVYGIMTLVCVFLYGHGLSFFMEGLNHTLFKHWGISDERNELARNRRSHKVAP